ncbi:MAG: HpcH/HpaI aldolase/citrate lyase family protein [Gammaproteobacteria bacterium]
MIKLMLITNNPEMAQFAVESGVNRIFVDLEVLGKQERQGHLDTLISRHSIQDVQRVRLAIPGSELLVRLNPYNAGTDQEIEAAISAGADLLMLPMFTRVQEVRDFCERVNGRAGVIPLVETLEAMATLPELVDVSGVAEVYIGLNDLHLCLGLDFMFELLANGMVESMAKIIKAANLPFGFGGIARVGEGLLSAEMILAEHMRLGSSSVILSRTFHRQSQEVSELQAHMDFKEEICKLREAEESFKQRTEEAAQRDQRAVVDIVAAIAQNIKRRRVK